MTDFPSSMMRAQCKPCGHMFDVCALPMPITQAVDTMQGARCPICGSGSHNHTIAPSRALTPEETTDAPAPLSS